MHTLKREGDGWKVIFVSPNGTGPAHERTVAKCKTAANAGRVVSWLNGSSADFSLTDVQWTIE